MKTYWWVAILAGVALGAWYYKHQQCPECQEKWNAFTTKARHWFAQKAHGFGNQVAE